MRIAHDGGGETTATESPLRHAAEAARHLPRMAGEERVSVAT